MQQVFSLFRQNWKYYVPTIPDKYDLILTVGGQVIYRAGRAAPPTDVTGVISLPNMMMMMKAATQTEETAITSSFF